MKSIELDCEILIDREYTGIKNSYGDVICEEMTHVEYKLIIERGKCDLFDIFKDSFKAKLLIDMPEKKIEISKTSLDLALDQAISNGAQTGKDFKEIVSKVLGFKDE